MLDPRLALSRQIICNNKKRVLYFLLSLTPSSPTHSIQSLLNDRLLTRLTRSLVGFSAFELRKSQNETGIYTQYGTEGVVSLGTQLISILNLMDTVIQRRCNKQVNLAQSVVDHKGICQGHTRFIRKPVPYSKRGAFEILIYSNCTNCCIIASVSFDIAT
jgi:hypothetical protein